MHHHTSYSQYTSVPLQKNMYCDMGINFRGICKRNPW